MCAVTVGTLHVRCSAAISALVWPRERIVPEPYTREMFEQTHRWMRAWDLFDPGAAARPDYGEAVLA